jgi:hypothetical protein
MSLKKNPLKKPLLGLVMREWQPRGGKKPQRRTEPQTMMTCPWQSKLFSGDKQGWCTKASIHKSLHFSKKILKNRQKISIFRKNLKE